MGLFSKLNFRAVDNAYHALTCFNFYSHVMIKACEVSETIEDNVDITAICEDVAHETAKNLGRMSSGELELQTAVNRVAIAAQGTVNDLTISSNFPQTAFVLAFLEKRMPDLGDEVLKAAKKGYLKGTISDHTYLMERNLEEVSASRNRLREKQTKLWTEAPTENLPSPPKDIELKIPQVKDTPSQTEEEDAKLNWLRSEWEFLQRKRAKGRQLDEYDEGLVRQYEELVDKVVK